MERESQLFFRTWALAIIVLVAVVIAVNAIMDPYLLLNAPRTGGINARKPVEFKDERLIKAYDVLRTAPRTLLLGTSTFDIGLDARDPMWPEHDRPAYNLGFIGGCNPYISYRYLQHVVSQHRLSLVVLGLDFEFFLKGRWPSQCMDPEAESRLVMTRDGSVNANRSWQHMLDLFQATVSLDALSESAATFLGNVNGELPDFVSGNIPETLPKMFGAPMGAYPTAARDLFHLRDYFGYRNEEVDESIMAEERTILDLCESRGISVILIINPVHADMLEILDRLGYWHAFEGWKRELVALTARYPDAEGRSRIPLWDFSGYDSYSTEAMPPDGHAMHWFWNTDHYTHALGDVIIKRILGTGRADFGVLLTPETLEPHLSDIREKQRLYREYRPADVRRVRELYDAVASNAAQIVAKGP